LEKIGMAAPPSAPPFMVMLDARALPALWAWRDAQIRLSDGISEPERSRRRAAAWYAAAHIAHDITGNPRLLRANDGEDTGMATARVAEDLLARYLTDGWEQLPTVRAARPTLVRGAPLRAGDVRPSAPIRRPCLSWRRLRRRGCPG
jgi:hypothetical protein